MFWRTSAISILLVFYSIHIGKMLLQKEQGIQTDQIAKRDKRVSCILHGIAYEDSNLFCCDGRGRKHFCGRIRFVDWDYDVWGASGDCRGYYFCCYRSDNAG